MPQNDGDLYGDMFCFAEGGGFIGCSLCWVGEANEVIQMGYSIQVSDRPNVGHKGASI